MRRFNNSKFDFRDDQDCINAQTWQASYDPSCWLTTYRLVSIEAPKRRIAWLSLIEALVAIVVGVVGMMIAASASVVDPVGLLIIAICFYFVLVGVFQARDAIVGR